jgi:dipeptidyl aminopeptidase/acylaminoacyl peptidase
MNYKQILLVFLFAIAANITTANAKDKLIPVEDFAKHSEYENVKISPDSKHLAFTYREDTEVKLAILNRKKKKITAIFEFGDWKQVTSFNWANNKRVIMNVRKVVGNLDKKSRGANLYAANVDGTQRKMIFTAQRSGYSLVSLYKEDPKNIILIKAHSADSNSVKEIAHVIAVKLNIYTGRLRKIKGQPKKSVGNILFDSHDKMRVATQYIPDLNKFGYGEYLVYVKNRQSGNWLKSKLSEYTNASFSYVGLSKDGDTAYFTSDKDSKTSVLYSVNLISGKKQKIFEHEYVNIGGIVTAEDYSILGYRYSPNFNEIKFIDTAHRESKALASLYAAFPGQDVSFTSYAKDATEAVVYVRSDTNPGVFYLFNFANNSLKHLMSTKSWIDPKQMSEMNPIQYTARDGLVIHGYLTIPRGLKAKNLPLIIHPHGGPFGPRDTWGFNDEVQMMASRGYAVLQMNFRGSGGYGSKFIERGYRQWGQTMQDDVTDATMWAIKKGIADPKRICISGASYGGYASLMGVVKEPNLYKCGLGYVGVYDLETMYSAGDTKGHKSGIRFLNHTLGEDKETLRANSPARNVEKIKAKLFIVHGKEDVRVPMEQYEMLTDALDKAKIPYRSMVRNEGHGYQKIKNRIDLYKAMEEFFAENLGK